MSFSKKIVNKHTISLASNAAMPVIGMLVLSLMAHNLQKADFGNYIFFLMVFTLSDTFRTGFMQTSVVKFYAGASKKKAINVAGSAWSIGFIITGAFFVVDLLLYLFFKSSNADIVATIKWFGVIYICTLPSAIASWLLPAEQRFDKLLMLQILNQGGFLVCVLGLIFFHEVTFETVIYGYLANNIVTSFVCIFAGWSKVHTIKYKTTQSMREMVNFGKFSVGTTLVSTLLSSSDTFIIKSKFPVELVGVYYIPQRLLEIFQIPIRAFVATAMPELSSAVHRKDDVEVSTIMKRYAGMLTVLFIPMAIGAFILGGIIIHLLFGKKFDNTDAVSIFRIFICYVMLLPIDRFFGITLDIIGKPHLNMIKVLLMLFVNVTGDFIGIALLHNLYGVAIASLFTFLTGALFGYWQLKKHLHFTIRDIFTLGYQQLKDVAMNLLRKNAKQEIV
ncbi:lipopolysaccharide biosynthesis protein [Mucilaginibacter sp.]|uniref:lipopolysaccharide biosynthesis protein n=1 Tax=Mucilaginibacter sp. TaxID=1882438 RepID=UPI0035BBC2B3